MLGLLSRWLPGAGGAAEDVLVAKEHHAETVDQAWLAMRRVSAAIVTAVFPMLFLLDSWVETPWSPVLPGILILLLIIIFFPLPATEIMLRRLDGLELKIRERRARRAARGARAALNLSILWFIIWIFFAV